MNLDEAFLKLRDANEPVPIPLRLPTPEEVDAAERDIRIPFHSDYRRFQLEASNVVVGVLEPFVVLPDMMPYLDLRKKVEDARQIGAPKDVLPICGDNGDYFYLDRAGQVGFLDHNGGGSCIIIKSSLADWIVDEWLGYLDEAG